jgi:hypothetical protein
VHNLNGEPMKTLNMTTQTVLEFIAGEAKDEPDILSPINTTVSIEPKSGCEASFYRINKRKGIKLFTVQKDAVESSRLQIKAWKNGAGPAVLDKDSGAKPTKTGYAKRFGILKKNGIEIHWGYYTQAVKTRDDFKNDHEFKNAYDAQYRRLYKALEEISAGEDLHWNNVGFIGKKMISIDFGECSTW